MLGKFQFQHFNVNTNFVSNTKQFINVNSKKNKIIKIKLPKFKLKKSINNKTYQSLYENELLEPYLKLNNRNELFCENVYKYILKQSQQLNHKHEKFPNCKNKYLVNKNWKYIYFMKGYNSNYSYFKQTNEIVYNKIVGNILDLYSHNDDKSKNYKIIFSKNIIKKLITEPHQNLSKFMKHNFSYDEDISKLNADVLYKCLNDMIYKTKHKFINLLLESYENIFGECNIESNGVVMELDYNNKNCFVNMKWTITKLMIM